MNENQFPHCGCGGTRCPVRIAPIIAWSGWGLFVLAWLAVSIWALVATNDPGSFIGGGVVVAATATIPVTVHLMLRWRP